MKINQTDNQIQIKTNGVAQFITGIIMILAGLVAAIFLPGTTSDNGTKTPGWVALIGIGIAVVGGVVLFFAKSRDVTLQKSGNTTVTTRRLLGGKQEQQTIPTSSIVAVRLYTYIDNTAQMNSNNTANTRRSVLSLVLNNNDLVELGSTGNGGEGTRFNGLNIGGLVTKAPLSKEANQISAFLGVPLQADDTSSISGAVKSIGSAFGQNQTPSQQPPFNPSPQNAPLPQQPANPPMPNDPPINPPRNIT